MAPQENRHSKAQVHRIKVKTQTERQDFYFFLFKTCYFYTLKLSSDTLTKQFSQGQIKAR